MADPIWLSRFIKINQIYFTKCKKNLFLFYKAKISTIDPFVVYKRTLKATNTLP